MVTFQFDINIYCATKLFFPSPMGCLGSSRQTAYLWLQPYFWQHEGWCCAAGV